MSAAAGAPPAFADPRAVLQQARLRPKKSWGQNFLRDAAVHACIAEAAGGVPGATVIELGAGLGALTQHLLHRGSAVVAVERDRELAPLLRAAFAEQGRFTLQEADAARLDYAALAAAHGAPLTVVGNLPYQLSSRILVNLAAAVPQVGRVVALVQREVAQRLTAPVGRDCGLLTVLVQRVFHAELLRLVPPSAFFPPPRVHSAVVRLQVREPALPAQAALVWVAKSAYAARRKTLTNTLSAACGLDKAAMAALLAGLDIDPRARPESLRVEDFARLGATLQARQLWPG